MYRNIQKRSTNANKRTMRLKTEYWERKNWQESYLKMLYIMSIIALINISVFIALKNFWLIIINTMTIILYITQWGSYKKWQKSQNQKETAKQKT